MGKTRGEHQRERVQTDHEALVPPVDDDGLDPFCLGIEAIVSITPPRKRWQVALDRGG
jgi:hypothetical protein